MPSLNRRELELALSENQGVYNIFLNIIENNFIKAKEILLKDFDSHVITREILGGSSDPINAKNISGTLGGYSNLFAFIGFNKGEDPISDLRTLLENISIESIEVKQTLKMSAKTAIPTEQEILESSRMPWENGRSWALSIETGISNFSNFMGQYRPSSRSGGGIQVEASYNKKYRYRPMGYLTPMFKMFLNNLSTKTGAYMSRTYGRKPSGKIYYATRGPRGFVKI